MMQAFDLVFDKFSSVFLEKVHCFKACLLIFIAFCHPPFCNVGTVVNFGGSINSGLMHKIVDSIKRGIIVYKEEIKDNIFFFIYDVLEYAMITSFQEVS